MINKKIVKRKIEITDDIFCDICGESCLVYKSKVDNPVREDYGEEFKVFEYMSLDACWGYHSDNKDNQRWSAQVCEKCVDEHLVPLIKFDGRKYKKSELRKLKIQKINK